LERIRLGNIDQQLIIAMEGCPTSPRSCTEWVPKILWPSLCDKLQGVACDHEKALRPMRQKSKKKEKAVAGNTDIRDYCTVLTGDSTTMEGWKKINVIPSSNV
jgi:hypothetical protein